MSEGTRSIRFTQYMLPDGRPEAIAIDRPIVVADKADQIRDAGFRLEAEVLTTGQVHMTVTSDEADVASVICSNGPEVLDAVDSMILGFDIEAAASYAEGESDG